MYVRLKHRVSQISWVIRGYSVTFEGNTGPGGVGQAHVHSAADDVMLSEIVRFRVLQPLLPLPLVLIRS